MRLKTMATAIALSLMIAALPAAAQLQTTYTYLHNDGEYSIQLPEAPRGETIWADSDNVPYLDLPPKFGAIGEYATYKYTDSETGDYIELKMTFVKADRDFLLSLTQDKMEGLMIRDLGDLMLDKKTISFSPGGDSLKWGVVTGIAVDADNNLTFNALHFLTGTQTILTVRVTYTAENAALKETYETIASSIKYVGR